MYRQPHRRHAPTWRRSPLLTTVIPVLSIAARFMPGRRVITQEQMAAMGGDADYSGDCSDAVLFTTRGSNVYDRTFMESFVRPGIGDEIERTVTWQDNSDVSVLAGKPVRLRFTMKDADLYSIQFK